MSPCRLYVDFSPCATGDRVGPFSTDQMIDWLLGGKPPKGINKQQAQQTAQNPPALLVAGIVSSDYNAQRLPGAKFFKPLGSLLALVAAGMAYQAVNKHDLQRGLPNKGWNESAGGPAGGAAAAGKPGATPPLPTGKGGKAAKAAAARANAAAAANSSKNAQLQGNRNNSQTPGARSRASTPGGGDGSDGGPSSSISSKSSSFKHPMALRQQQRQRQQEALLAAAGQAGLPGAQNPGAQLGKGLAGGVEGAAGAGGRMGTPGAQQPGSASRAILSAPGAAGLQQQQQFVAGAAAVAAQQAAAAGRFVPGLPGAPQQQFLNPQQQMQAAASMAFLQTPQGATQAVWLKQQQGMPAQALPAGMYPAGQALLGYPGMPGYPMAAVAGAQQMGGGPDAAAAAAAAAAMMQGQTGLPRISSTGSAAQQQPPPPSVSGAHTAQLLQQQQMLATTDAQGRLQIRPGVPAFAMAAGQQQPGAATAVLGGAAQQQQQQPGLSPSPQQMHAAALLFLHDQQQQQQKPDKPASRWWVQRSELAFTGPLTGLQMYQAYLQPGGPVRLTETTLIASIGASPAAAANRDVPPSRAFAPMSCLLEAAAQGFVLVPWPSSAAAGGHDTGPPSLMVQQAATGATMPLHSVLSQQSVLVLQQQQQGGGDRGGDDASSQATPKHGQQQPQMLSAVRPAAGGYVQLPNGSIVPAAGLVPVQGGGLAMLQPAAAQAAAVPQQAPAVDPLAVANALFTAGGLPNTIVWYIRTDGTAAAGGGGGADGEGGQGSSIQGPFDPQVRFSLHVIDS